MASHRGKHIVCYHGHSYMSDHFDICLSKVSDRKGYTRYKSFLFFEHRPQPRGSVLISLCYLINGAVLFLLSRHCSENWYFSTSFSKLFSLSFMAVFRKIFTMRASLEIKNFISFIVRSLDHN